LKIALLELNYPFNILVDYKISITAIHSPREVVRTLAGTAGRTSCWPIAINRHY
jgi:hypothetical protein